MKGIWLIAGPLACASAAFAQTSTPMQTRPMLGQTMPNRPVPGPPPVNPDPGNPTQPTDRTMPMPEQAPRTTTEAPVNPDMSNGTPMATDPVSNHADPSVMSRDSASTSRQKAKRRPR